MTRDDIIHMARECQLIGMRPHLDGIYEQALERFAALVAEREREACAKVCEEVGNRDADTHAWDAAAAIRAALAAPRPEPVRHPGYVIGNHWLETAYARLCAGEAEDAILEDYDLVREPRLREQHAEIERLKAERDEAVKAEREACAKACDKVECGAGMMIEERHTANECARKIRARGQS